MSGALAAYDGRPFFDRALAFGAAQGLLAPARLAQIEADMAKGVVQIAGYFGSAHLRPELELALTRMVRLMSLYLEEASGGELAAAAASLRDRSLLSHSKGGSDLLKALLALPDNCAVLDSAVTPERQRAWLDDKTGAHPMSHADYRAELAARRANQATLDLAYWLGERLGARRDDIDDAEALIRSALLTLFFGKAGGLKLPTRAGFVALVDAARRPRAKFDPLRVETFLAAAPAALAEAGQRALARFLEHDVPRLRAPDASADALLDGESAQPYFVRESLDEDAAVYDRLVAREWHRVTRGDADDPQVVATVMLRLATGLAPKPALLLKEAKALIAAFRERGFDTDAVLGYINSHAPQAQQRELRSFWNAELRPEAEEGLADTDPNWPDAYMERALAYLHRTVKPGWKARGR